MGTKHTHPEVKTEAKGTSKQGAEKNILIQEETGGRWKLHNLQSSLNIISVTKSSRMRWICDHMGQMKNAYKMSSENIKGDDHLDI